VSTIINAKTELGTAVKEARSSSGLTQRELAESLNISTRYLMRIENGQRKPSYNLLCLIVSKLDIQTESVFRPTLEQSRKEIDRLNVLLQYCTKHQLSIITATVHAIVRGS
jgi:transcriptional regulator with XRE-family HTH domain